MIQNSNINFNSGKFDNLKPIVQKNLIFKWYEKLNKILCFP